ncbi:uncharacterized protein LOC144660015 [Oculina patagonica]
MGKEMAAIHGSYKTWLCNAALFALICAAFAAGILLGPIVSSRGKNDLKEIRCSPDEASTRLGERGADSECISQKQLGQFVQQWSRAMNELIEEKMVNISRRKINPAIRKLSRAKDAAMKKTIEEMLNAILANWTAQLSQHMYSLPSGEPRATHTIVTEDDIVKPTTETELDVIEVDSVEPATQDTHVNIPVPIALYPLNGKYTTWDISGRSNPNGLARGVRLASGPDGLPQGSYQFSGKSSSYIEFPNTGALRAKNSITLLAWVYVKSRGGPIFNYNPLGWGVSLWVNSKHYLSAKFVEGDDGCTTCFISALPLKTNAWNYVGMSYDHTSGIAKLWVDGRVSSQRNIGTKISLSTSRSVRMGARATNDGNYFNGRISRMQVYDRALTQREVEVLAGPIEAGACPQGWTGYHSSCYLVFNRLTNQWNQARQVCQEHGGDLVEIESPEENHFVYTLANSKAPGGRFLWIGLLRGSPDERFQWVDDPAPTLYSNWALSEPNNFHGRGENCGHMYIWKGEKAMQWNDEVCVNPTIGPMIFMCEMKPVDFGPKPAKTGNSIDEEGSGEPGSGSGEFSGESESTSGDDLQNGL